jgi:hypothetical protein
MFPYIQGPPFMLPVAPVKSKFFSELPVVIPNTLEPEVTVKFTAVALLAPAVLPMLMVPEAL